MIYFGSLTHFVIYLSSFKADIMYDHLASLKTEHVYEG
jgi:hypothetical protein